MLKAQTRTRYHKGLRQILIFGGQAFYMAVAARAMVEGGASPFAVACFTAGLYMGLDFKPLLLGVIAGYPWEAISLRATGTVAGCLAALGIWALVNRLKDGEYIFNAWLDEASAEALTAATAVVPGIVAAIIGGGDAFQIAACSLIAMALAPVISFASEVKATRTALLGEERMAVAVLLFIAILGLARSPASFLVGPFAALLTLVASYSGASFGAAVGAVAGVAAALASGDASLAAALALMGLTAGVTLPLGRGWSAVSFVLANTAVVMFVEIDGLVAVSPLACVVVGVIYALVDEDALERFTGWMAPTSSMPDASALAARLRQASAKRLQALGKVFDTLADGYGDFPQGADEQSLTGKMRSALCEGCPGYEKCWSGNDDRAGRLLCSLLAGALKGEPIGELDELPPEIARSCRRAAIIPRKLAPLLKRFDMDRKRHIRSRSAASTLSRHFTSAGNIIRDMSLSLESPLDVDNDMCRVAVAALEREGFYDTRVIVLYTDSIEVAATRDEIWLEDDARVAQSALSKALAAPLRAAFSRGGDVTLRLVQAPRLSANVGYACRPLTPGQPCGDSYAATGLGAGRVLIVLSDGMGSGARAAGESERTVELIKRFLSADVDDALTLDAINQLLLLRGGDEMFATADICVVDLNKAKARFVKQGACASYIIRNKSVETVEGGKLPLGILDEVCPGQRETPLGSGDVIVMITDGVADPANDDDCKWLAGTLSLFHDMSSDVICRELIRLSSERGARDDMTAIAITVSRAR